MGGTVLIFLSFCIGSAIGSFANAAAMRVTEERRWYGAERSACDVCGRRLEARDLVPLLSFILLRGRCRFCGARIARRHFYSELAGGAALSLFAWKFGFSTALAFSAAALLFMIFHSLTDLFTGYIYDSWAYAMALCGFVLRLFGGLPALFDGILGAAAGFAVIGAFILLSRGRMGYGDALLALGIGAFLGLRFLLLALYSGFMIGGAAALLLLLAQRVTRKTAIPLAPFLCIGMGLAMLAGSEIFSFWGYTTTWPWNII